MSVPEPVCKPSDLNLPGFLDDEASQLVHAIYEDPVDKTGKAVFETPFTDLFIHTEVMLPHGSNYIQARPKAKF